jgi:hypothetical protein
LTPLAQKKELINYTFDQHRRSCFAKKPEPKILEEEKFLGFKSNHEKLYPDHVHARVHSVREKK